MKVRYRLRERIERWNTETVVFYVQYLLIVSLFTIAGLIIFQLDRAEELVPYGTFDPVVIRERLDALCRTTSC